MPPKHKPANDDWLTIFTLKINYADQTFTPSSKHKLIALQHPKLKCSCANLSNIHPSTDLDDFFQGLLPSRAHKAQFLFSGNKKLERARKLCVTDLGKKHDNQRDFRLWMLSLVAQLSELCESDHRQDRRQPREPGLRPFKDGTISKNDLCEGVSKILQAPLSSSEKEAHGMGYVYVLRDQTGACTFGELKIGFSKYHPEHRAHELARCLAKPEVVSHTPLLPHAKRLESIIHKELEAVRKVQHCRRCEHNHQEWFTVSHADSREILKRWGRWILQRPYVDGQLTDKWEDYLAGKKFASVNVNTSLSEFWQNTIDGFPEDELQENESQRVGEYLNDCYWDFSCAQWGIDQFGKDFCDGLRKDSTFKSDDIDDVKIYLSMTTKILRALEEEENGGDSDQYWIKQYDDNYLTRSLFENFAAPGVSKNTPVCPDAPVHSLIGAETSLGRLFHPETKNGHVFGPGKSPGTLLCLMLRAKESSRTRTSNLIKKLEAFNNLKTGAPSVSDAFLGITESPLGDATILPILALDDLKHLNAPVANWVGMNPTNAGFQLLQEAYREGKWLGGKPQFKLPKAYRKAGYRRVPTPGATKGPSKRTRGDRATSNLPENESDPGHHFDKPSFKLTRGQDFDEYTWSQPINEEFIQALAKDVEECRIDGGASMKRKIAKEFRRFGIDIGSDVSSDEESTDSDTSSSDRSSTSEEEQHDAHRTPRRDLSSTIPAKRTASSGLTRSGITAKKAKLWLESL